MDGKYLAPIGLILLIGLGALVSGTFSGLDLSGNECTWTDLEINDRTFSSVDEFEQAWKQNGEEPWSTIEEKFDFRTQDGILQYRSCTVEAN